MSKTALVIVAAVIVIIVLYRRGLARKKVAWQTSIDAEIMAANALPRREVAQYNPSVSEVLTSEAPTRVSTTITKAEYDALPKAKIVNIETGVISDATGWGPMAPRREDDQTLTREEVAAMQPIVYSSPTATRGNYRTAL